MNPTRRMLIGLAATLALPHPPFAQSRGGIKRVAILLVWRKDSAGSARVRSQLVKSMEGFGYKEGQNIAYEWRFAEDDLDRVPSLAAEVVALKPDAIVTQQAVNTHALAKATRTIPILGGIDDPIREGFAASGSAVMPRGNVTGFADRFSERWVKLFEVLKSCVPGLRRFAILAPEGAPVALDLMRAVEAEASKLGIEAETTLFRTRDDIERAFASMPSKGVRAATANYGWTVMRPEELAELALRHRIALVGEWTGYARHGGLLTHDADWGNVVHRQAIQLEKVLRGIPPSKIPFELPERWVLSINRKTATALKLTIPPEVYLRAEHVFEDWQDDRKPAAK